MTDYSEKFEKMRIAGKLAAQTLDMLTDNIKEGISTAYIDKLGYEFIRDNGGHSAPLFYRGFSKSLCTSLNHVVCHGIPSRDRILEEGDAVNVDVTAIINDHYGDTSRMFSVGQTSVKLKNLIDATYESMMRAIQILKPGIKLGDIGYEIQSYVEKKGYKTYLIFLVQIQNMEKFKIAKDIDSEYYRNYLAAKKAGVNFLAYRCKINSKEILIEKKLKIIND